MIEKLLYPLKYIPIEKRLIWGKELWLISGLEGDETEVLEGFLSENTPNELSEIYMGDMVGDKLYLKYGSEFPILVKEIITTEQLSVQVHPSNELAAERHNAYGKSELWYVNEAKEGAHLYMGLLSGTTKEQYIDAIERGTIADILNKVEVKAGDIFFIPAGTIHSIGAGITITEVQQSSDITYRLFDWNRMGDDDAPRELHTDLALDAIDFSAAKPINLRREWTQGEPEMINANDHFITEILDLDGEYSLDYSGDDSFVLLVALEGSADVEYDIDGVVGLDKGDLVMIPAALDDVKIVGRAKIMKVEPTSV